MVYKVSTDTYLAAVIDGTVRLSEWLSGVPKEKLESLKIDSMPYQSYPFSFIEVKIQDKRIFLPANLDSSVEEEALSKMNLKLLAVYRIEKDFLGDSLGNDVMGILPHAHRDEEE